MASQCLHVFVADEGLGADARGVDVGVDAGATQQVLDAFQGGRETAIGGEAEGDCFPTEGEDGGEEVPQISRDVDREVGEGNAVVYPLGQLRGGDDGEIGDQARPPEGGGAVGDFGGGCVPWGASEWLNICHIVLR